MKSRMQHLVAGLLALPVVIASISSAHAASDAPKDPWAEYPLMKAAPRAVFAHVMVSFRTRWRSGRWKGWNYSNKKVRHDPDKKDNDGRPDIASIYTPLTGPYDMTDPELVEYHCQLLKMAGLDGFMFDLGFHDRPAAKWADQSMKLYAAAMRRYGLKAVVIYEDKVHWIWNRSITTRAAAVQAAYADMTHWLGVFKDVQYKVGRRPLFAFFSYEHQRADKGISRLSPGEISAWKKRFPARSRPILAAQWFKMPYKGVLNGGYDWPRIDGKPPPGSLYRTYTDMAGARRFQRQREKAAAWRLKTGAADFHIGGVWPGFDDRGCWGWGDGPRFIPRLDGKMYEYQWERALANGYPVIQIASWNDWFEGHNIEPAVEFGYKYLEMTRTYAARFKGTTPPAGNFRVPEWIYKIRKSSRDPRVLRVMARASLAIQKRRFKRAEALVKPYAARYKIQAIKYWTPPRQANK